MNLVPIAATSAASAFMAWATRGRASQVFGRSVWRGPRTRREIALTFDDGPSESTPQLLELLAQYRVPATFFQCGANVDRLPEIAREVAAGGHEIGNHTYSHPYLFRCSPARIEEELRRAQDSIARHTNTTPGWFRAPYGVRWFGLASAQRKMRLTGVMWSVIGYDWSSQAEEVVDRLVEGVDNGAILCLHDGRELSSKPDIRVTVEAVRRVIPVLLEHRYEFRTIGRLICPMT